MSRQPARLSAPATPSAAVARARLLSAISQDRAARLVPDGRPLPPALHREAREEREGREATSAQPDLLARLLAQEFAPGERP